MVTFFYFHIFFPSTLKKEFVPYECYGLKLIKKHITLVPFFFSLPSVLFFHVLFFLQAFLPSIVLPFSHSFNKSLLSKCSLGLPRWC